VQEGGYYTLVWVSSYLSDGEEACVGHLHEIDAEWGMLLSWCYHEHTRVVGDSADPHQHERNLLPEDLQDGVCKAGAPLDRSREAHQQSLL
jgi:hypothetical protein